MILLPSFAVVAVTLSIVRRSWFRLLREYTAEAFVFAVSSVCAILVQTGIAVLFISPNWAGLFLFGITVSISGMLVYFSFQFRQILVSLP